MAELKACPFCGWDAYYRDVEETWVGGCETNGDFDQPMCPCCIVDSEDKITADTWNTRPIEDKQRELIAELRAEVEGLRGRLEKAKRLMAGCHEKYTYCGAAQGYPSIDKVTYGRVVEALSPDTTEGE